MSLVRNLKGLHDPADVKWIATKLEKMYKDDNRTGVIQKTTFSPSTIVYGHGMCPTYWWFAFNGVEWRATNSAKDIAGMNYGTNRHGVLQDMFEKFDEFVENEREIIYSDPPIRGFCDVVLQEGGEEILGEIKTTKHESWIRRQMEGPAPYHLIQLGTYMKVEKVERGFLLYENKNTQQLLIFPVYLDEKLNNDLNQMFDWMRSVRKAWSDKEKPARVFTEKSRQCGGCPVSEVCWGEPDGEREVGRLPILR
jgi:CRISPR/Cas system-associated exonuclease Cas4 (RecB family)